MIYPSYTLAATEAAIAGYGVIFEQMGKIGVVWWEGETRHTRGLSW